jgi:HEAT repeat protein
VGLRNVGAKRSEDFVALRGLLAPDADVSPDDRQRAIYALGRWGEPSVVPQVVALLPTLKETHCLTAIEALGRLGTSPARVAIESYSHHESPHVRKFVVEALNRIGDSAADAILRKIASDDREPWVRELASKRVQARRGHG